MGRVNIAGAGLAGLSAAIFLAEKGIKCNLISVQPSERAQSVLAEGGINAALDIMGESDSPEEHFTDTMRGGADIADPNAVSGLVYHAPEIMRWLVNLGVPFQMEGNRLILRNFGGQKKKRTAYTKSSTGKIIMSALIDEVRKHEAAGMITRYPHHEVVDLVIDKNSDGQCCRGLKILDTYKDELHFFPGAVILAIGGMNGIFPEHTTGTAQNTGDITATAFVKGVELSNPEFIQYHPTTVGIPGKRMLVSEAARGEGGRLYILRHGKPWYFMEELYPEMGNLMTRDVISREMTAVCGKSNCQGQVYLDMTGLERKVWETKLSDMREELIDYLRIDPMAHPIEVKPGIHYFMGGIGVDEKHRTNVRELYAAGECACQYHGANRLGGNSMLSAIYGGRVAAESAMALQVSDADRGMSEIVNLGNISDAIRAQRHISSGFSAKLRDILLSGLGIIRSEEQLFWALRKIDEWDAAGKLTVAEHNRILLGKAMLLAALKRQESRGAHYRADYPDRDDERFQKTTIAVCEDGDIEIKFRSVPKRRMTHEGKN